MKGIASLEISTDLTWSSLTGTWTAIADSAILKEGFSIGPPEAFSETYADERDRANGFKWPVVIPFVAGTASIPANGTAFWLKATDVAGSEMYYGGADGIVGWTEADGVKPLSQGQALDIVRGSMVGVNKAAVMKAS